MEPSREYRSLTDLKLRHRFHVRLTVAYGLASMLALAVLGWSSYRFTLDAELDGMRNRLLGMAVSIAAAIDPDDLVVLETRDDLERPEFQHVFDQLEAITDELPVIDAIYIMGPTDDPDTLRVFVDVTPGDDDPSWPGRLYDATGLDVMQRGLVEPAVEQRPWEDDYGLTLSGYAPVHTSAGEPLGLVGVDIDAASIDRVRARVLRTTLLVLGGVGLFLTLIGLQVGRSLRHPLSKVMGVATEVASGNFKARVDLDRRDEFGLLARTFDKMTVGLAERELLHETFGRYVNPAVADRLLEAGQVDLGGEERDVTVMLTDLAGYSTISENSAPSEVVLLLNQYLGAMNTIIDEHHGCIIEYTGDGILAVFGAPHDLPGHPGAAVRCSLKMREALSELNDRWEAEGHAEMWQSQGIERLEARIGLHRGRVVAGNLGSETRLKFAVIGDTVNVAARLEQLNKEVGSDILVSEPVFTALPDELGELATDQGVHKVKGRSEGIHVWSF